MKAHWNNNTGFTLVEALISLAIISLLVAVLAGIFERSSRLYTTQNAAAALQQEVCTALDVIAAEVRMAAYDPKKTGNFVIKSASATEFRFWSDLDGNGILGQAPSSSNGDGECEARSIRYSLSAKSVQIRCGDGTPYTKDTETLIGDTSHLKVTALDFAYKDRHNNPTATPGEIRSVVISIKARAPAGRDGLIERTYSTIVNIRNAGT